MVTGDEEMILVIMEAELSGVCDAAASVATAMVIAIAMVILNGVYLFDRIEWKNEQIFTYFILIQFDRNVIAC